MTSFETYLESIGYIKHCLVRKGKQLVLEKTDCQYFSTMVHLQYYYLKDGHQIVFGLNEKDKPPTLVWPRPEGITNDDQMNRLLNDKTPEEIYESIYNISGT